MHTTIRQLPYQPGIDGSHQQVTLLCFLSGTRYMVENPFGATGREIRVDEQSGFLLHHLTIASLFQLVTDLRTAHALPYHGVAYGLAGGLIPYHDGLTLVGDRQGVVVLFEVLVFQQFFHHP